MLRTFNCGVGMILVVAPQQADEVIDHLANAGEQPFIVGQLIDKSENPNVVYSSRLDWG
jgi:phosphoribosylformylglycinamidine cyclo-ligase